MLYVCGMLSELLWLINSEDSQQEEFANDEKLLLLLLY